MLANILVIADDISAAELLQYQLEQAGYAVRLAADGTDGLRLAYVWQPDLILAKPYDHSELLACIEAVLRR